MAREDRPDHAEALLAAVSYAVKKFSATPRWQDAALDVLEHLGRAAGVSRAYIYKNFTDGAGRLCQDLVFEWSAPGIAPTIGLDWAHGWPYEEGYQHYRDVLESGGVMETRRSEVSEIERQDYEEAGVFSSLLVPVFAGGEWWGYMGYEDCVEERAWSRLETEVVRTAAETLGGEIQWTELEAELSETEKRFRVLVENTPAVLYIDQPGDEMATLYIGPQIEPILGITQHDWLTDEDVWERNLHPDDRDRILDEYRVMMAAGSPVVTQEYRLVRPDNGEIVWVRDDTTFLKNDEGEVYLIQGVMFDITKQKVAEEQLREAQAQFQTLVEEIPAITYLDPVDENESSIYVSPQVESILGITQDEWLTDPTIWRSMLHPDDAVRVWDEYVDSRASGEPLRHEYRMVRSDGHVVWIREDAVVLKNEQGEPFLIQGLMYDITDRKEAEEQIAFLAYHDALTKLPNRAMFEEMLEPALARARRGNLSVAVLFMDLDGFKDVNDTLGHDAGDQLLRELAARLVEATRDTDLVARQGGDEFLVLLPDLDPGDAEDMGIGTDNAIAVCEKLADRIHRAMRAPFVVADTEVHSSISVGISLFPNDALDARSLMKNADAAMYESKKSRPGGYSIHAGSSSDPLTSLTFTRRLRKAVKSQSWVLQYQPVVDLSTDRVVSVEALVRWRRPTGDLMSPAEFLPLAEEMGLMGIIGEWVFEELCRQRGLWLREGIDIDVSFNLSPRQLGQRDLLERLMIGLRNAEIEPQRVIIEVSESTAMTDPARTQRILWGLHEQGLRIAVDDFGTGYSPPARIAQLPVDILKIDQPLVRDLPDDKDAASFVKAVVDFVRDLGTISQAEGIETEQQRQFLVDVGCQQGQGYLFSRPLPADSFTTLFKKGNGLLSP